jgi:hypothetical protein
MTNLLSRWTCAALLATSVGCLADESADLTDDLGQGKADDYCAAGDGCSEFEQFKISRSALCPIDFDCSGFVELSADGTLRLDQTDAPGAPIATTEVDAGDLQAAVDVLTSPALLATLSAGEPPCELPFDVTELMSVTVGGKQHSVLTTFCGEPELEAARRAMERLTFEHVPGAFGAFSISTTGFCAPDADCDSFLRLTADGILELDRRGELPVVVHEATISEDDLADAVAVLMSPEALDGLAAGDVACDGPTDIHEVMTLAHRNGARSQGTTFCDAPYLTALRQVMGSLGAEYFPE